MGQCGDVPRVVSYSRVQRVGLMGRRAAAVTSFGSLCALRAAFMFQSASRCRPYISSGAWRGYLCDIVSRNRGLFNAGAG